MPDATVRPNADLAKSGYIADVFWAGEIDFFNLYNQSLSDYQALSLYNASFGTSALSCTFAPSTTPYIPTGALFFSATFTVNPATLYGVTSPTNYGWINREANGDESHQGILVLNGCTAGNCAGNYVDLSNATGPNSIGQVLPPFGGVGTGSFTGQTVGWSFEVTFKPYQQTAWAKVNNRNNSHTFQHISDW